MSVRRLSGRLLLARQRRHFLTETCFRSSYSHHCCHEPWPKARRENMLTTSFDMIRFHMCANLSVFLPTAMAAVPSPVVDEHKRIPRHILNRRLVPKRGRPAYFGQISAKMPTKCQENASELAKKCKSDVCGFTASCAATPEFAAALAAAPTAPLTSPLSNAPIAAPKPGPPPPPPCAAMFVMTFLAVARADDSGPPWPKTELRETATVCTEGPSCVWEDTWTWEIRTYTVTSAKSHLP